MKSAERIFESIAGAITGNGARRTEENSGVISALTTMPTTKRAVRILTKSRGNTVQTWGAEEVARVKAEAMKSPAGHARLFASSETDGVQEMLIALRKGADVTWHWHEHDESMQIVEGSMGILYDDGQMQWKGEASIMFLDERTFFVRIPKMTGHTVYATSDVCVFIERSPGPWKRAATHRLKEAA